ncbi:MAG: hypothetical protein ACPGTU_15730 [Myxococcota bacterium]
MRLNRSFVFILTFAACHLGRPAIQPGGFTVGTVVAPVSEPGIEDALRDGLSLALASLGALGGKSASPINMTVASASTAPMAVGDGQQVHTATLRIVARVGGRETSLSGQRQYSVRGPNQADAARAEAFRVLALALTADAVHWMRYAPVEGS